eukprot:6206513-Amphidinium_carterae.1
MGHSNGCHSHVGQRWLSRSDWAMPFAWHECHFQRFPHTGSSCQRKRIVNIAPLGNLEVLIDEALLSYASGPNFPKIAAFLCGLWRQS